MDDLRTVGSFVAYPKTLYEFYYPTILSIIVCTCFFVLLTLLLRSQHCCHMVTA